MINITKISSTLSNSKFKKLKLPNFISNYTQPTYHDLRNDTDKYALEIKQQEEIKNAIETGIEVNVIKSDNITGFNNLIKKEDTVNYKVSDIKYSSYINYIENSTFDLPEDLKKSSQ